MSKRIDPPGIDEVDRAALRLAQGANKPSNLVEPTGSAVYRVAKRTLDILLASLLLVITAPVFFVVSLAIKFQDGGPVFYRQRRWGYGGRTFNVYKFRSMAVESQQVEAIRPASVDDDRVTVLGRFLRRAGMDELPQLLNILKGEMSFVGPRALAVGEMIKDPERGRVSYEEVPGFWERLAARPGLTGVATIYLPKDAPPAEKFRYDIAYAARQSVWLDLKLIALSFWISFRGKWETRARKI